MRSFTKTHVCIAAVTLVVLFVHRQSNIGFGGSVKNAWHGSGYRIVVFGDDWSDNGNYRVSPPDRSSVVARDSDRGEVWTETLCKEVSKRPRAREGSGANTLQLNCPAVENFASSLPVTANNTTVGALIDSDVYAQARDRPGEDNVIDFKTQVQQYLAYEKGRFHIPQRL